MLTFSFSIWVPDAHVFTLRENARPLFRYVCYPSIQRAKLYLGLFPARKTLQKEIPRTSIYEQVTSGWGVSGTPTVFPVLLGPSSKKMLPVTLCKE